jgi:hypothetical protein
MVNYATVKGRASELVKSSKWRARRAGVPHDLTRAWAVAQMVPGVCAVTGARLDFARGSRGRANPFAPSLDRVIPSRGYVQGNCRIVAYIYNIMRLDWGDGVLEEFVDNWRGKRK